MRQLAFIILLHLSTLAFGQKQVSLGIHLYGRHDQHANYFGHSNFIGSSTQTKLEGWSRGAEARLGLPVTKGVTFNMAIGYYNLTVDKIELKNSMMTTTERRVFLENYPPLQYIGTNTYHYHNLSLTGGLSYERSMNNRWSLQTGADFTYLFSLSQSYEITNDNSTQKQSDNRKLGFGANAYVGALLHLGSTYYLNPRVIAPVYQRLYADPVFKDDPSLRMEKKFNRLGFSLGFGTYL